MLFKVTHTTRYTYEEPVSESVGELRVHPTTCPSQTVHDCKISLSPDTPLDGFSDFFGNSVHAFSIPARHQVLKVRVESLVETFPDQAPKLDSDLTFGDARRPFRGNNLDRTLYRLPTQSVPLIDGTDVLPFRLLRDSASLQDALINLNSWIHGNFEYRSGSTSVSTPLKTVLEKRQGVCQDFAHLMLSLLRARGIVCRYVSGYIEASDPSSDEVLTGAHASHAWVEVLLGNDTWWGLDPTNNQPAGERHIRLAVGRDYHDVAPLRGTYKGAAKQYLEVSVSVQRQLTISHR